MEAVPKGLKTTIRRFAGMRRRVRLTLSSGSTTINASDILRVRLPSRSLVDLGSFGFHGTLATDASQYVAGGHTLIRRLGMTCGGVQLGYQNNNYANVAHALNLAGRGLQADEGDCMSGINPRDMKTNGDFIEFNYFPQSPLAMGYLWTEATGECEVDIAFHGAEPLVTSKGGSPAGTWSVSNLVAYVDVIDMETDAYASAVKSALNSGAGYEKLVPLATAVVQENTGVNSMNISTKCLDKVIFAPKISAYTTRAAQSANQVYNNFLDFPTGATGAGADYSAFIEIGSSVFPQQGYGNNYAELAQITRGCYGNGAYNFNKLFLGADASGAVLTNVPLTHGASNYVVRNGVAMFPVGAFDEEGVEGGLDLSSGNSVIQFNSKGVNLLTRKCLLAGLHKGTLSCKSGQVVSVQQ